MRQGYRTAAPHTGAELSARPPTLPYRHHTVELTALRQFIAIAREGHVTRAAETLGVGQPTLSAMLKKLEAELGTPLLDRTGRGVALTAAGRAFLEHAETAVRAADRAAEAVRELLGLESGIVRVGSGATVTTALLPRTCSAFLADHPGVRVSLREAGSSEVARDVLAGQLDLGIVTLPVEAVGAAELMTVATIEDELRLVTPPHHPLRRQQDFVWDDLAAERIVAFEAGSAVRRQIDRAAAEHGHTLSVVMELRSIESIRRMVSAGVGVGFVSRLVLPAQASDAGLTCRSGAIRRTLAVIRRRDHTPSPAAAAFETLFLQNLPSSHAQNR